MTGSICNFLCFCCSYAWLICLFFILLFVWLIFVNYNCRTCLHVLFNDIMWCDPLVLTSLLYWPPYYDHIKNICHLHVLSYCFISFFCGCENGEEVEELKGQRKRKAQQPPGKKKQRYFWFWCFDVFHFLLLTFYLLLITSYFLLFT